MKIDQAAVRAWVAGVLAGIYQPEPDEEIWEWAERTLRIPATENEEKAGQFWSSKLTPYVRDLMRWVKRPGKGEYWIKKSSQVGFTMAVLIIVCWFICHRAGNIAYAIDSVVEARNISRTRLQRWITDNALLASTGNSEDDVGNLTYYLKNTTVYMMGAYSPGGWANKSIVLFILDELDKHPFIEGEGTTTDLARERCKRPKNAKVIGFCTPGETNLITKEWESGTREEVHVPCPHCGFYQPFRWENFKFGTAEFRDLAEGYDLEKVRTGAYFECENVACRGRIEEKHKLTILDRPEHIATNPKAPKNIRSLHIWDAYSPFVTFGQLAVEWILAQGDPVKIERFVRGRRGEKHEQQGGAIDAQQVLALRSGYNRGNCPITPILYASATDVQKDHVKTVKGAFNARGDLFIIDWEKGADFDQVAEFADKPVEGPGKIELTVQAGLIDEGDGNRYEEVRRWCLNRIRQGDSRFWPVKGRGGFQVRGMVTTSAQWCDGEEILTYHIDDRSHKWVLFRRIREDKKNQEKSYPRLFLPMNADFDEEFIDELTNERPVLIKNKFGREVWEWKLPKDKQNDWWDGIKYLLALWNIMAPLLREQHPEMQPRPSTPRPDATALAGGE
jgi:phage terminase large subunit GpA-like protein